MTPYTSTASNRQGYREDEDVRHEQRQPAGSPEPPVQPANNRGNEERDDSGQRHQGQRTAGNPQAQQGGNRQANADGDLCL